MADAERPVPPIKSTLAAHGRRLSRAETLGIPVSVISTQRRVNTPLPGASGLAMVPSLARELLGIIQDAACIREAVRGWWDVNVTPRADAEFEKELLAELMEVMRPALLLGAVFVGLRGEPPAASATEPAPVTASVSARTSSATSRPRCRETNRPP